VGKMEVAVRRVERRRQLLDDLTKKRIYWKLKKGMLFGGKFTL